MSRVHVRRFIFVLCLGFFAPVLCIAAAAGEAQALIQLLDYVAADYPHAVQNGQVVSKSEYGEMREFSANIVKHAAVLNKKEFLNQAIKLKALVEKRGDVAQLRGMAAALRTMLITEFGIAVAPTRTPDPILGQKLFNENCASCHGASGLGDGPLARTLQPAPTNFHDTERYRQRSLYGLYSTLSLGVAGTAMPAFQTLSEHERWSLAFHVGSLAAPPSETVTPAAAPTDLSELTGSTPAEWVARHGEKSANLMGAFRHNPQAFFAAAPSPVALSRNLLKQSLEAYIAGNAAEAYRLALAAYLDGFELAEGALNAVDPQLKIHLEEQMLALRSAMQNKASQTEVQQQAQAVDAQLAVVEDRLGSRKLAGGSAAFAAFIILLREGLEAILVIAALAAFLVKTGQPAGLKYLYAGGIGALVLGWATWWISEHLFFIGGLQRELTEGLGALIAAAVMFSVGFWMHGRAQSAQWMRFIHNSVKQALSRGTLWGLAGLSFIAVYRECFETVLFYQALWAQTDVTAKSAAIGGILCAVGTLVVLAWAIMKYSVRLPLREFFAATGILLFVLAVIFAGKGIVATQAAGLIPVLPVNAPRIELLGIYPNAQSLLTQAVLVLLAAVVIWRGRTPVKA